VDHPHRRCYPRRVGLGLIFGGGQPDWLLRRATRAYTEVEKSLYAANPNPAEWTEAQDRKLGRYLRYRTANTNIVLKCRKAVEDYRKARLAEQITEQKLEAIQKKNNPTIVDWKQQLEQMRQKAVALGYTPPER
jgi:hypothetical protein